MLTELVFIIHAGIVLFNIFAFVAIVGGISFRWAWTANRLFRFTHIFLLGIVALQALLGRLCPLTILEFRLRQAAGEAAIEESFIVRVIENFIYYDLPLWIFALVYCLAFLLALWLLKAYPPKGKNRKAP
ncbi:MAG: DUF2784 domain-containing protein [Proteobacteria bacterium]|nr:DUF2784 domain-containing protein [Pseudomonadota bacterium]